MHPNGSKSQLDHIIINSKWVNSLRNCRAYSSVEIDSDHRIVSIALKASLRTSKGKPCKRLKFNWKKLQTPSAKHQFQIKLSNRFKALQETDSISVTERYSLFEEVVVQLQKK